MDWNILGRALAGLESGEETLKQRRNRELENLRIVWRDTRDRNVYNQMYEEYLRSDEQMFDDNMEKLGGKYMRRNRDGKRRS